jgi:hypothetical protein
VQLNWVIPIFSDAMLSCEAVGTGFSILGVFYCLQELFWW